MAPHRKRVEESRRAKKRPDFEPPAWQGYKRHFARAQHGKCGYCEANVLATGVGDVEHFRPKGAISELSEDPKSWGHERRDLANIEGRKTHRISDCGYWWLAYSWKNWLLACERCNRACKGSLFPVAEDPRPMPSPDMVETPLLLDPLGSENPGAHLQFDPLGQIKAVRGSRIGAATIQTLNLDRLRLRDSRVEKAKRIHALVHSLESVEGEVLEATLADILEMGQPEYPHAGMVRAVFEQNAEFDWADLEERCSGATPFEHQG